MTQAERLHEVMIQAREVESKQQVIPQVLLKIKPETLFDRWLTADDTRGFMFRYPWKRNMPSIRQAFGEKYRVKMAWILCNCLEAVPGGPMEHWILPKPGDETLNRYETALRAFLLMSITNELAGPYLGGLLRAGYENQGVVYRPWLNRAQELEQLIKSDGFRLIDPPITGAQGIYRAI